MWRAIAVKGTVRYSILPGSCQQVNASRPPGRSAAAMLANAAVGSSKNITPNLEIATSKAAGGKDQVWASACSKEALEMPSRAARRRASVSITADRSTPRACPPAAARAARTVVSPQPQPMSSTDSAGWILAASSNRTVWGASIRSCRAFSATKSRPSPPFHACACAVFAVMPPPLTISR